jgi:hypothetical protein
LQQHLAERQVRVARSGVGVAGARCHEQFWKPFLRLVQELQREVVLPAPGSPAMKVVMPEPPSTCDSCSCNLASCASRPTKGAGLMMAVSGMRGFPGSACRGLSSDPSAAKQGWCCLVPWKVDNGPYIAAVGCCRNANKQFPPASRSGAGGDKESSP